MYLQDTAKHVILRGHYGIYNELDDSALATDSAFAIEYSQGDSLYIHADTLKLITIVDSTKLKLNKILEQPAAIEALELTDSIGTASLPLDSIAQIAEEVQTQSEAIIADITDEEVVIPGDSIESKPPTCQNHRPLILYPNDSA